MHASGHNQGPEDLVLAAGTLRTSNVMARIAAAAAAGFSGITMFPHDLLVAERYGTSLGDIRACLQHHAMRVAELDALTHWAPHHQGQSAPRPGATVEDLQAALWRTVAALSPRVINVVEMGTTTASLDVGAAALERVRSRASAYGTRIQLEPLAWSGIATVQQAITLVRMVDHADVGVCLDTWQLCRAGERVSDFDVSVWHRVMGVQIGDARPQAGSDLVHEAMHDRLLPGAGVAEIAATLEGVLRHRIEAPVVVEVWSDELASLPVAEAARLAFDAGRQVTSMASGNSSR